jgi:arylsulfatase
MKAGERWNEAKYHEMNLRYQEQTKKQLRKLAGEGKPFFLQYWPLYPLTGPRTTTDKYTTPNGGTYVEKMKLVDQWIGELMDLMDDLGIADNTLVIVMGDIDATRSEILAKYGSIDGYVTKGLGLTKREIQSLRHRLLE